jgi:hypothetical protein
MSERTGGLAAAGKEGIDEGKLVLQVGDGLGAAQRETQDTHAQDGQRDSRQRERLDLVSVALAFR